MTIAEDIKATWGGSTLYKAAMLVQTHRMIKGDKVTVFFEDRSSLTFKKVFQLED